MFSIFNIFIESPPWVHSTTYPKYGLKKSTILSKNINDVNKTHAKARLDLKTKMKNTQDMWLFGARPPHQDAGCLKTVDFYKTCIEW